MDSIRVFFSCSGVGIINRGIESFFREAFDGLKGMGGAEITLYKGAGEEKLDERVLRNLPRTSWLAQSLGVAIRRNGYVAEQLSTFPSMVCAIRRERPDVIFYSDSNLGFQLFRWRKQIGVPFRLLFSNGGPCHPPFNRTDFVQQVAPLYFEEALTAGEPAARQRLVPYGINVPAGAPNKDPRLRRDLRERLNLPTDRQIVLSVGWIAARQKRMDYLINEISGMSSECPFLVLLGAMDQESEAIIHLAEEKLGRGNFAIRSVPYERVGTYYQAADIFVLASLNEGFGRVLLEGLIHGLPVVAHENPVIRFVVGDEGYLSDLSKRGGVVDALDRIDQSHSSASLAVRRRESIRQRFSWPVLTEQYRQMFADCAHVALRN